MLTTYQKRIVRSLRQITQYLDSHSRQLLKAHDITVPQVLCLNELQEKGSMTVAILAENLLISASTLVGIVDRLEEKELVTRTRDAHDRRMIYVNITPKGRDFLVATPQLLHNRLHKALNEMEENEQIAIANSLERVVHLIYKTIPIALLPTAIGGYASFINAICTFCA